ncbi:MAG: branched-chain amino acid ABC transporter permease [Candidatus Rokubacteria bacterium]|nr:branched-chain amino acid ABC transporter permease [Candidatus Rokubacteria bacterium]
MAWGLALSGVAAVAPLVLPVFLVTTVTEVMILALFALSLDLLVGYTGLDSFGHAAAYGLGAYTASLLLLHAGSPLPVAVGLAAAATALVAVPMGWLCTRTTGVSFAMLTLAFAQLLYAVAYKWQSVTGGSDGLAGVPRMAGPFGITWFTSRTGYYYLVAVCLAASYAFCRAFVASPVGTTLLAIRDHERKAEALGYNARAYKLAAFVAASFFGGLAGALYAPFAGFASPELFFWIVSGQVLIMVIVGGSGTLIGPMFGAAFFLLLEHHLSAVTDSWALVLGLIFIAVVIFVPDGLYGLVRRRPPAVARSRPVPEREHGQPVP